MRTMLFLLIAQFLTRSTTNFIKGVSKQDQNLYRSTHDQKFKCFDNSLTIPFTFINDDYCDCADGSDEPGTNACPYSVFVCRNVGWKELKISSMDINDKICNCCDGSDEEIGTCANTCGVLAAEEKERIMKRIEMLETAKTKIAENHRDFDTKIQNIKDILLPLKTKLSDDTRTVNDLKNNNIVEIDKLNNLKSNFIPIWQNDLKIKCSNDIFSVIDTDNDKIISLIEFQNSGVFKYFDIETFKDLMIFPLNQQDFVNIWFENFPPFSEQPRETDSPKIDEENQEYEDSREIPVDLPAEPKTENFDEKNEDNLDENYEEYTDEEKEEISHERNEENNQKLPEEIHHEKSEEIPTDEIEYGEDGLPIQKPKNEESRHHKLPKHRHRHRHQPTDNLHRFKNIYQEYLDKKDSPTNEEIIKIEENIHQTNSSIKSLHKNIFNLTRHLNFLESYDSLDFGPDRAYSLLFDLCITFESSPFKYEICPFYKATQERHGNVYTIGYWKNWSDEEPKYTKMVYDDGDECYGDTKRSFQIHLSCGSENLVKSVTENEVCKYFVELETPAACVHEEIPKIHDEL